MNLADSYLPYVGLILATWMTAILYRGWSQRVALETDAGHAEEPPSLHPAINPALCIGCGACVAACPEAQVLSMIGNKAELTDASSCIGHGACKTSCPTDAIELVFGSARRGVDLPQVGADFQTNVPGLYIAGELGGMGLVANAVEQGCQAIAAISQRDDIGQPGLLDVVIIGAGPAGLAASLAAKDKDLRYATLEQGSLGGTVAQYPRDKIVMTRPAHLPLYGTFKARRVSKEQLLGVWRDVVDKTGVDIRAGVRVESIGKTATGFEVKTATETLQSQTVLLATGRRGAPRKLDVPGENLKKVVYAVVDADQFSGKRVLVVGGGSSAVEAALDLARIGSVDVTLCYRGKAFDRAKTELRGELAKAEAARRLTVLKETRVASIESDHVDVEVRGENRRLANDAVVVCVGGLLPMKLLEGLGVHVETKFGSS
jgi:thioredoxin reductase (NADPH)